MGSITRLSLIFIASVGMLACSYPLAELGLINTDTVPRVQIDLKALGEKKIDFELLKAVPLRTCLECHTTGSRSMNTAEKVMSLKGDILESVHSQSMPPKSSGYTPLNACEVKILETWIEDQSQGRVTEAKVKDLPACADMKAPEAKKPVDFKNLELTFENVKKEIFAPKCMTCHNDNPYNYLYRFDDVERMRDNELIKDKAEDSRLYLVTIPGMTDSPMPPPNKGIAPLTADEADFLKRWIDAGAN